MCACVLCVRMLKIARHHHVCMCCTGLYFMYVSSLSMNQFAADLACMRYHKTEIVAHANCYFFLSSFSEPSAVLSEAMTTY